MDPGAGHVESGARERVVCGKRRAKLVSEKGGRPGDRRRVDATRITGQADVIDYQRFERRVAGPLAKSEERAVRGRAAVEPGGHGVDFAPVKIVMPMPFEVLRFDPESAREELHQARHAARQRCFRPGQPEPHRVAEPELHRYAGLPSQLLQRSDQRSDEPVEVGTRQVLEMAAG